MAALMILYTVYTYVRLYVYTYLDFVKVGIGNEIALIQVEFDYGICLFNSTTIDI